MDEPLVVNGATIIQSGCHGSFVGRLDVEIGGGKIAVVRHELIPVDDTIPPDREMQEAVEKVVAPHRALLAEVVGQTATALNRNTFLEATMDNLLLQGGRGGRRDAHRVFQWLALRRADPGRPRHGGARCESARYLRPVRRRTFVTVLAVGIERGILIGAAQTIALYLWRTSRPHMADKGHRVRAIVIEFLVPDEKLLDARPGRVFKFHIDREAEAARPSAGKDRSLGCVRDCLRSSPASHGRSVPPRTRAGWVARCSRGHSLAGVRPERVFGH